MLSRHLQDINDLDKKMALLGVILSVITFLFIIYYLNSLNYSIIALLILISCIIWLLVRKRGLATLYIIESNNPNFVRVRKMLAISFFILQTFVIVILYLRAEPYQRPILYYVFIFIMGIIVVSEIFISKEQNSHIVLFHIILLGVNIAWSQNLLFPGLTGIDPWYHYSFTNLIIVNGTIPSDQAYSLLPLFHILTAISSIIGGMSYKLAVMLISGLGQITVNVIFVYLLGRAITKNHQIGLLASLFVVFACYHIQMSVNFIPNSLASIFIPILLYLLIKMGTDNSPRIVAISLLFMIAAILTHTIAALCIALILFTGFLALQLYESKSSRVYFNIPIQIPILFTVTMFSWWIYASGSIGTVAKFFQGSQEIDINERLSNIIPLEHLLNNLSMYFFIAFVVIGLLYMISAKRSNIMFSYAIMGTVPLVLGFFPFIFGQKFISNRWYFIAQILLSIPFSISLVYLSQKMNRRITKHIFITGIILILMFFSVMSSVANVDKQYFSENSSVRYALTDSELGTFVYASQVSGFSVYSDEYYSSRMSSLGYEANSFNNNLVIKNNSGSINHVILIRNEIIKNPSILQENELNIILIPKISQEEDTYNKIIDDNTVDGYINNIIKNG